MVEPLVPAVAGRGYFRETRGWFYSAAVVIPVLLAYQAGVAVLDGVLSIPIRNGADVLLQQVAAFAGPIGRVGLPILVVLVLAGLALNERLRRATALKRAFLGGMLLESLLYAVLFGALVARATAAILPAARTLDATPLLNQLPLGGQLVLSLGAGIYEEILFRGLVLGGLRFGLGLFSGVSTAIRELVAVVGAAAIFSAYHYLGAFGDPFTLSSFTFRLFFGVVFSGLLVARGFGVTVLTHALYDVLVTVGL